LDSKEANYSLREMKTTRVSASLSIIRKAARKLLRHSKNISICSKKDSFAGVFVEQGRVPVPVKFGLAIGAGALGALCIRALARRR